MLEIFKILTRKTKLQLESTFCNFRVKDVLLLKVSKLTFQDFPNNPGELIGK